LKNDTFEGLAGPDLATKTAESKDRQTVQHNVNFAQTAVVAGRDF